MTMNVTRRAVLGFGGGAALGIALSPAPWKLIDDLGIWTQNWKWIPRPPQGPVTVKTTTCSLCPAACGVQARCIGGSPVAMRAVANDPIGAGALCPLGQTGHHLRYHPTRLTSPARVSRKGGVTTEAVSLDAVVTETSKALRRNGSVAVLDMRPGRSVSWGWRRLVAELPDGVVITAPNRDGASLSTLCGMLQGDAPAVGVDLEHARAILSFGAPLAEGWGSARVTAKLLRRAKGEVHVIQVDPLRTRTAQIADRWLAARPGTEAVLALGIGHVLLKEGLAIADGVKATTDIAEYTTLVERFDPATVAQITGVPADAIVAAARELGANLPSIVIAGEDAGGGRFGSLTETAIFGLNALLAVPGQEGCVFAHQELPAPFADTKLAAVRELSEVRDGSVSLLIIDSSAGEGIMPWPVVARKLTPDARVIAISPYASGLALHADFIVPAAPFLEGTHELPTPFDATRPMLALATPIGAPGESNVDPIDFARKAFFAASIDLPSEWMTSEELIRARVAAIHAAADGEVLSLTDGSTTAVSGLASADDLWTALAEGGRWQGGATAATPLKWTAAGGRAAELASLIKTQKNEGLTIVLRATRDAVASPAVSPVLSKLYQESALRRSAGTAAINPQTARQLRLRAGRLARLETKGGSTDVMIATDAAVMPNVVEVTVGPDPTALGDQKRARRSGVLDICSADANGVWRSSTAKLVEA